MLGRLKRPFGRLHDRHFVGPWKAQAFPSMCSTYCKVQMNFLRFDSWQDRTRLNANWPNVSRSWRAVFAKSQSTLGRLVGRTQKCRTSAGNQMGLDASVWCDCFERNRLRSSPPAGCHLSVGKDGSLDCGSDDLDVQLAFDQWQQLEACEHEDGYLLSHYIGNIALVASLRAELGRWPDQFPMLLSRVIYNGVHAGDYIPAEQVSQLLPELAKLADVHCTEPDMEQFMRRFELQMRELVDAALRVEKAIVF